MDDADLTRRLQDARPPLPRRGDPLSPDASNALRRIVDTPPRAAAPTRRKTPAHLALVAAIGVIFAVVLGVVVSIQPSPGYAAATPPLLQPTPIDGTPDEVLRSLAADLDPAPVLTSRTETIKFQFWGLSMTVDEDGNIGDLTVNPERRTFTYGRDGVRIESRRGQPYDAAGSAVKVEGYRLGELVWSEEFAPDEYSFAYPEPPVTAAEYARYFADTSHLDQPTAGHVINELSSLLTEHALSATQTRAVFEYLATLPDIQVEGRVHDRLGRSGISFATDSRTPGAYVDRLIVSDAGLGVLSTEVIYIGHDRTDIQAPTVIKYTAWE